MPPAPTPNETLRAFAQEVSALRVIGSATNYGCSLPSCMPSTHELLPVVAEASAMLGLVRMEVQAGASSAREAAVQQVFEYAAATLLAFMRAEAESLLTKMNLPEELVRQMSGATLPNELKGLYERWEEARSQATNRMHQAMVAVLTGDCDNMPGREETRNAIKGTVGASKAFVTRLITYANDKTKPYDFLLMAVADNAKTLVLAPAYATEIDAASQARVISERISELAVMVNMKRPSAEQLKMIGKDMLPARHAFAVAFKDFGEANCNIPAGGACFLPCGVCAVPGVVDFVKSCTKAQVKPWSKDLQGPVPKPNIPGLTGGAARPGERAPIAAVWEDRKDKMEEAQRKWGEQARAAGAAYANQAGMYAGGWPVPGRGEDQVKARWTGE